MTHPCLTCGACCASFRVDFSVYETQELGGDVPDGLAVDVTDTLRRMRGTDHSPRAALPSPARWAPRPPAASTNGAPRPAASSHPAARPVSARGSATGWGPTLTIEWKIGL
jgi:hypothetical protein